MNMRPYALGLMRRQSGLTLVEVMVAMAIGLILLVALGSMLIGSIRHYKVQDDFSRMQENGAYALNAIGNDVRMAGFYGEIGAINFVGANGSGLAMSSTDTDCGMAWAVSVDQPIFGYDPITAAAAQTHYSCIATSNFIDNSPVLLLRGAAGNEETALDSTKDAYKYTLYVQSSPGGGVLFQGVSYPYPVPAVLNTPWRMRPNGTAAPIYPYQVHLYYLRPCSRPTGNNSTCLATDDDGNPVPTLVRQELTQGVNPIAMTEQPVAEGIERLSVMYGEDLDGDGFPNIYRNAASVVTWPNVVTVRLAVLARSTKPTQGYNDSGKSYDMGDGGAAVTCAGTGCSYHRHVFAQTFQARNISQRMLP